MGKHESGTAGSSWRPTEKVLAAWVTGSGATLILGILTWVTHSVNPGTFWGGLVAYVATGAAAWIKKSKRPATTEGEQGVG
jgi:hypothetical protein